MLHELKIFFFQNWKEICAVILFIVSFVIGLFSKMKKGVSFSDVIRGLIAEQLPKWISEAEAHGGTGEQKKVQVLNDALNYACKTLGRKLSEAETSFIVQQASDLIEKILSTPQKKEDQKEEVKKNAKYRQ